ncbi:hypothetical protein KIN20_024854 [Parelaphostrongylus tenuis]|uniref:Uncharacterized protein n=1 Tax=Parelaphostrongylus tenuis TaxID=148309 RepID=A0AAD5QWZ8_PARTN|nr:hypothetical protein KIN20_024854 [Parelaphostrongylus tenuis]
MWTAEPANSTAGHHNATQFHHLLEICQKSLHESGLCKVHNLPDIAYVRTVVDNEVSRMGTE